jgi:hypothetical protein
METLKEKLKAKQIEEMNKLNSLAGFLKDAKKAFEEARDKYKAQELILVRTLSKHGRSGRRRKPRAKKNKTAEK